MKSNSMLLVMVSCQDESQAERIGKQLIKKRLAACTQITPRVSSLFLWPPKENNVKLADEAILVIKTLENKWKDVEKEVQLLHTYENPEIIGLPVTHVSDAYFKWLEAELS